MSLYRRVRLFSRSVHSFMLSCKINEWKSVVATLSMSFTPITRQVLPKLQSIIEILSLNLSGLYNKISLCNISDSSAAKNSIKRQIV